MSKVSFATREEFISISKVMKQSIHAGSYVIDLWMHLGILKRPGEDRLAPWATRTCVLWLHDARQGMHQLLIELVLLYSLTLLQVKTPLQQLPVQHSLAHVQQATHQATKQRQHLQQSLQWRSHPQSPWQRQGVSPPMLPGKQIKAKHQMTPLRPRDCTKKTRKDRSRLQQSANKVSSRRAKPLRETTVRYQMMLQRRMQVKVMSLLQYLSLRCRQQVVCTQSQAHLQLG